MIVAGTRRPSRASTRGRDDLECSFFIANSLLQTQRFERGIGAYDEEPAPDAWACRPGPPGSGPGNPESSPVMQCEMRARIVQRIATFLCDRSPPRFRDRA